MKLSWVRFTFYFCISLCLYKLLYCQNLELETLYGTVTVVEPVILELIQDSWMQRLKHIHQYGVSHYILGCEDEHNRFNHSIGVWLLLARFGASLEEQVAGLLHDVSHTAFSHLGDKVYRQNTLDDVYQDDIHEEFIAKTSLASTLTHYNYTAKAIHPKNKRFRALEPDLPEISADRLEYNLSDGFFAGLITKADIQDILKALQFDGAKCFFTDIQTAKRFASISLYLTTQVWGSAVSQIIDQWAAQAILRAFEIKLISQTEFNTSTDDKLWLSLINSDDTIISGYIHKMLNYNRYFIVDTGNYTTIIKAKFRGINPWVKVGNKFYRLTELDTEFKQEFELVKYTMDQGWHIKFL